jgi:hypothetical protein
MVRPLLNSSDGRRPRRARPIAHRDSADDERPAKAIKTRQRASVSVTSAAGPAALAHDAVRLSYHPPNRSPSRLSLPPDQSTLLHAPSSRLSTTRRQKHVAAVTKAVVAPGGRPAAAHTSTATRTTTATTTTATTGSLPRTRPPTRVTVSRPNGELVQATNGVEKPLSIRENPPAPGVATDSAEAKGNSLVVPQANGHKDADKRSLRSQAGGSRLKSDLSIYFSNYDEVISGEEKEPGRSQLIAAIRPTANGG